MNAFAAAVRGELIKLFRKFSRESCATAKGVQSRYTMEAIQTAATANGFLRNISNVGIKKVLFVSIETFDYCTLFKFNRQGEKSIFGSNPEFAPSRRRR